MATCEELEVQRILIEEQIQIAADAITAAEQLKLAYEQDLYYNWWNRYLQGCIPGMSPEGDTSFSIANGATFNVVAEKVTYTREQFDSLIKQNPILLKLITEYMKSHR